MADIKKLPISKEAKARHRRKVAWQTKQSETNSATDGQRALNEIEQWRLEKKETLQLNDRVVIAQNLGKELAQYRGKLEDLYISADLPRNIKDKVALPPGMPPPGKVGRLKAEVGPYLELIKALHKETKEDVHLIADRVLLGTRFHPVSLAKLQEAQLILEALQVAVDLVDREFNLWAHCKAIAEIRKSREKAYVDAVRRGDQESARIELQFYDDDIPRTAGKHVERWWPLEPFGLTWNGLPPNVLVEPANAFWCRPYRYHDSWAAGAWSGESIFFFPHMYIGPAIEWYGSKPEQYEEDQLWVDIGTDPEPHVQFDEESQEYLVYLRDPTSGEAHHGGAEFDWNMSQAMSLAAHWLIIYPDPKTERLIPAIFSRGEFASTSLLPLSARLIAEFGDDQHWQYVGRDGAPTLLQRLKDLTGFITGDFKVMNAWRETAERFHLNPIFRSCDPSETENIIYRRHLEKWIAENRRSTDSHDDE